MGSPLGPSLANAFLARPFEYRLLYYQRYVDDIFVLLKSSDDLKQFQSYLNSCHVNKIKTIETEHNNKISFLDVNVIGEQCRFITRVYRVYIHFDSFLTDNYKICFIYTLVNTYSQICSI